MEPRRSFRFLKELSEGAFGKVYLAEMITGDNFKSVVAIKLLHGKWSDHEEIVQRSRDEARVLGLLHHRNIIRVEDLTSINGQCAIIMEYLDGVDLKTLVNHAKDSERIIPRRIIFEVGSQVASALEAAYHHQPLQGGEPLRLIHRDIKPSNVMVTRAGDVKVLDFGTAQAQFDHREAHTQALAFGSAAYMAPERLAGDPDAPSGDVFSLGITLYEMLARQSYGKIHLRPEKFDAKLAGRLEDLDLTDLDEERALQVRQTLGVLLAYDAGDRPDTSTAVDILESLAESIHDGSMRRYCRDVVAPLKDSMQPEQDPEDPITGSTLFEDVSNFADLMADEPDPPPRSNPTWIDDSSREDVVDAASASGAAAVAVGGGKPAPSLRMPSLSSFESSALDRSAQPSLEVEDDEVSAASPAGGPSVTEPETANLGARPLPAPGAQGLPERPFTGPGTLDASVQRDQADADAAAAPAPASPGVDLDLFTAPTVHRSPREDDDIYREYDDGPVGPARESFRPQGGPAASPAPAPTAPAPTAPVAAAGVSDAPRPAPPAPARAKGGRGLLVAGLLAFVVLGGGGAAIALSGALGGGDGEVRHVNSNGGGGAPDSDRLGGGTVNVGTVDAEHGTLRLTMRPPGSASVDVLSTTSDTKFAWDGSGQLELVGVTGGTWRTKVTPAGGGRAERGVLEVQPGESCAFTFEGGAWSEGGCE